MAKNIIIGQSGGPTAVINSSLAGVYKAARSLGADKVYGMKYGIEGLLKEELLELNVLLDDRMSIELLKRTPSSYLGSCRFKLPDPDTDATPFVKRRVIAGIRENPVDLLFIAGDLFHRQCSFLLAFKISSFFIKTPPCQVFFAYFNYTHTKFSCQ